MRALCFALAAVVFGLNTCSGVEIINLGTLGGPSSEAEDINNHGQITGDSKNPAGEFRAFIYQNGVMSDLGDLGGDFSFGNGINDNGVVVGTADTGSNEQFSQRGAIFESGSVTALAPSQLRSPSAINNSGTIVGINFTTNRGFVYANNVLTEIGALGGYQSAARDVNASGQVVGGISFFPESKSLAILFDGGMVTDLGSLGGTRSYAHGINDAGHIVGSTTDASGDQLGFIYQDGVMTGIPGTAVALDINNHGQVVGLSNPASSEFRAFLYDGNTTIDLNDLLPANSGWMLERANAINDLGMIVGRGKFNGESRAFLMTVPEPTVPISMLCGLVALLGTSRLRRPTRLRR